MSSDEQNDLPARTRDALLTAIVQDLERSTRTTKIVDLAQAYRIVMAVEEDAHHHPGPPSGLPIA